MGTSDSEIAPPCMLPPSLSTGLLGRAHHHYFGIGDVVMDQCHLAQGGIPGIGCGRGDKREIVVLAWNEGEIVVCCRSWNGLG